MTKKVPQNEILCLQPEIKTSNRLYSFLASFSHYFVVFVVLLDAHNGIPYELQY